MVLAILDCLNANGYNFAHPPKMVVLDLCKLISIHRKSLCNISTGVVTTPDFAMLYVSRYLGRDAIRIALLGSRCYTYRDTWVAMRYVSRYLGRDSILGSRCDTYRDTWVTMRYVSRYLGHDAIRIAILGSRCYTCRVTWVTMLYVSRYLGRDAIRIAILGSRCYTYRDTWVAMRYVSRYLGHDAIRIAILVYRVIQCLYLHILFYEAWQCNIIYRHTSTYKYS